MNSELKEKSATDLLNNKCMKCNNKLLPLEDAFDKTCFNCYMKSKEKYLDNYKPDFLQYFYLFTVNSLSVFFIGALSMIIYYVSNSLLFSLVCLIILSSFYVVLYLVAVIDSVIYGDDFILV